MKTHLAISENPLPVNRTVETCCGQKIEHAKVVYAWDSQEMGPGSWTGIENRFCSECLANVPADADRKYIYGVIQPKAAKTRGDE
jgi:hypothetical protein